jgi:hypothetical protein
MKTHKAIELKKMGLTVFANLDQRPDHMNYCSALIPCFLKSGATWSSRERRLMTPLSMMRAHGMRQGQDAR